MICKWFDFITVGDLLKIKSGQYFSTQPPLQRVSKEHLDGQFLFSPMGFYFICFFGLSAFLFYHGQSISLLCHRCFGGQIENGPMDSFFFR